MGREWKQPNYQGLFWFNCQTKERKVLQKLIMAWSWQWHENNFWISCCFFERRGQVWTWLATCFPYRLVKSTKYKRSDRKMLVFVRYKWISGLIAFHLHWLFPLNTWSMKGLDQLVLFVTHGYKTRLSPDPVIPKLDFLLPWAVPWDSDHKNDWECDFSLPVQMHCPRPPWDVCQSIHSQNIQKPEELRTWVTWASSTESMCLGLRKSSKYSFHRPTMSPVELNSSLLSTASSSLVTKRSARISSKPTKRFSPWPH